MSKVRTEYANGGRFYVAEDEPNVKVPGVTSILNMIPKPFLQAWSAKMAAELAVDSLPHLHTMVERDKKGAVDYIKGAARRYTQERADIGSAAHDMFERMISNEPVGSVSAELEPYRKYFLEFLDVVQPELVDAENVAWSSSYGYAGSFDALLRVRVNPDTKTVDPTGSPVLLMSDYKTGKSTYPDVALQLAAYAHADYIIDADGGSRPMPGFNGGAVLHITDKGWTFKSVRIDDEVFDIFLGLLEAFHTVQSWSDGKESIDKSVIGKPLAKGAGRLVSGTERRAR